MRWGAHKATVRRSKKRESDARRERDRNLSAVSDRCARQRRKTTKLCKADRDRIRAKARSIIAREKAFRRDATDDYRQRSAKTATLAKTPRYSAAEHDSLTEHNVSEQYVELWRELKQNFPRTVTPDHRAELFAEWIEEHPQEVTAWRAERYEVSPEQYAAAYEAHASETVPF